MSTRKVIWFPLYFLFVAAWILVFSLQGAAQSDLEKIVGTWKLVSIESVMTSGEVSDAWMGRNPLGLITRGIGSGLAITHAGPRR